ncbi:hypothetical protein DFS34DRAFT_578708 [Phlyctochytrium arcticum]|nr:hypothetical protein DFS34DRAFT_578708 [Phlyctochytrium arcticum]
MSFQLWRIAVPSSRKGPAVSTAAACVSTLRTSLFHTSSSTCNRVPALQVRISRRAWEKNQEKIARLQKKLGDRYGEIGRDKRRSPPTTTRSSTKLSQPAPQPPPENKLLRVLATPEGPTPVPIVVGQLSQSLESDAVQEQIRAAKEANAKLAAGGGRGGGIRMRKAQVSDQSSVKRDLSLPAAIVPPSFPSLISKSSRHTVQLPEGVPALPLPAVTAGPYYSHGLTRAEIETVFVDAPALQNSENTFKGEDAQQLPEQQAEMVRRILSLENANKKELTKFNVGRCVTLFGREAHDTGSPEVQAAILTVRIESMRDHLIAHRKDISTKRKLEQWVSKRTKMLKYLRRTDLPKFVETCKVIGVEPDLIRV